MQEIHKRQGEGIQAEIIATKTLRHEEFFNHGLTRIFTDLIRCGFSSRRHLSAEAMAKEDGVALPFRGNDSYEMGCNYRGNQKTTY